MKNLLSVKQAAEYLSVSIFYLYKLSSLKKVPHVKIGTRIMFREDELERWINSHVVKQEG